MSFSSTLLFGGLTGVLGVAGGVSLGRAAEAREAVKKMAYMDDIAFDDEAKKIHEGFKEYAEMIARQFGSAFVKKNQDDNPAHNPIAEEFKKLMLQNCFIDDTQPGADIRGTRMMRMPLLRQACEYDDSERGIGPESDKAIYDSFDAYYRERGDVPFDKHDMIVHYLDNMTYVIISYLKKLQERPGDQYRKAINALEEAYGLLLHNFNLVESNQFDSKIVTALRKMADIFTAYRFNLSDSKKKLLADKLKLQYRRQFEHSKAYQKNLSLQKTAEKVKTTINQQATYMLQFMLRQFQPVVRPSKEAFSLESLKNGVDLPQLRNGDIKFDTQHVGILVKKYAEKIYSLFSRTNEQNPNGNIIRFSEHFKKGELDATTNQIIETAIKSSLDPKAAEADRQLLTDIASILNGLTFAYALQAELCIELGKVGSSAMVASGELELRQSNINDMYDDAIRKLQGLAKTHHARFFPQVMQGKVGLLEPHIKDFLGIDENVTVHIPANTDNTLYHSIKRLHTDIEAFRLEMQHQIRDITHDNTMRKDIQFSATSGSYTSEMALICAHNVEIGKIISDDKAASSLSGNAQKRRAEIKDKLAAFSQLESLYKCIHGIIEESNIDLRTYDPEIYALMNPDILSFTNLSNPKALEAEVQKIRQTITKFDDIDTQRSKSIVRHVTSDKALLLGKEIRKTLNDDILPLLERLHGSFNVSVVDYELNNQTLRQLNDGLKAEQDKAVEYHAQVSDVSQKLASLKDDTASLRVANEAATRSLESATTSNAKLINDSSRTFISLTNILEGKLTKYQSRIQEFRNQLQGIQANAQNNQVKIKLDNDLKAFKDEMKDDFETLLATIVEMKQALGQALINQREDLIAADAKLTECRDIIQRSQSTITELQGIIDALEQQLQLVQAQAITNETKIKEKAKYQALQSLMSDTLLHGGRGFVGSQKHTVMNQVVTDFNALLADDARTLAEFKIEAAKTFNKFVIIAMDKRSSPRIFKSQTTTGEYLVKQLNKGNNRSDNLKAVLNADIPNLYYTNGVANYWTIANTFALNATHEQTRSSASNVLNKADVNQLTVLTRFRK